MPRYDFLLDTYDTEEGILMKVSPAHFAVVAISLLCTALAQAVPRGLACRMVHLWYRADPSVAFYNEVSAEKSAPGTYFAVCGWSRGYFGMQELSDGRKVVIFSVWDPAAGDDPAAVPLKKQVKMLYKDPQVRAGRFGNEGTGGQSFFDYDWKPQTTYRFFVTARAEGPDRTAYSGHFYLPEKRAWKHLVTFSTLTPKGELLQGHYSFVEDFRRNQVSVTQARRATFGNGWIESATGAWVALGKAKFNADPGSSRNIDAGPAGSGFFLATGGDTVNATARLLETMTRPSGGAKRPADLPEAR